MLGEHDVTWRRDDVIRVLQSVGLAQGDRPNSVRELPERAERRPTSDASLSEVVRSRNMLCAPRQRESSSSVNMVERLPVLEPGHVSDKCVIMCSEHLS